MNTSFQTNKNSQNSDPAEIAKFEKEAAHWWDRNSAAGPLHHLNPARLQFITDCTSLTNKKVIDIGCGGGILTESLAKKGAVVTGIDASTMLIEVAKKHADTEKLSIHYESVTAEDFAEKHPEQFDIVTCMELLEHVPDPKSLIEAAARLTKPGGQLFFSTLNRNLKSYFFAILAAEYVLRILPKNTHEYEKLIRPSELQTWLQSSGLKLEELAGLSYNPLTKEAYINKNISINYLAAAKKPA